MSEVFHITLSKDQDEEVMKRDLRTFLLEHTFGETRIIQHRDLVSEVYERCSGSAVQLMYSAGKDKLILQETIYHGGFDEAAEGVEPLEKICDACLLLTGHDEQSRESAKFTFDLINYLNHKNYQANY